MAVAAYASLLSLAHILDQQIRHPVHRLDTGQLRSLQEKVTHLQHFLEHQSQTKISQVVEDLARQIPAVANEAEDVIDSHVVFQLASQDTSSERDAAAALSSFYEDLDQVIQKIDSIIKELNGWQKRNWTMSKNQNSLRIHCPTMLVHQEHFFPVARIVPWWDLTTAWSGSLTSLREMSQISKSSRLLGWEGEEYSLAELGKQLHQKLFGRRYLIVMDDVWSNKAWDDLKQFFPNNGNRSRVLVTTRTSDLAVSLGSKDPYLMDFLDKENCWNLLCVKVFGQEGCPFPELEQIGKDIAKGCRGLPLALVVIGGLLAKSNMTREYWESV
ncbi:putative late blight resistance proteinR1A-10 [Sesamum angolense]|uniref:Late blight resistance proteinR1A-10 n=1 Tax=Sesamum angolense TaxID=2727404 RepID=A0AAE1XC66_9LAMI|nr:putative late blight resistance proteinR1A-10 [Sesamum angolense]